MYAVRRVQGVFPFFFPLFFWCGTLTIKHGEGVLTMVLWVQCGDTCIPDVEKKKARKKEKKRRTIPALHGLI